MQNQPTNATTEQPAPGWRGRGHLTKLVEELERQRESRVDFVADQRTMRFLGHDGGRLGSGDKQTGEWLPDPLRFTDDALAQFGERQDPTIPRKFLRAAVDAHPDAIADYINTVMMRSPKRNLVRCLDGRVRAVISDTYRMIDNYDVAFEALTAVRDNGGEVIEATLSDRYMRLKFTSRDIFDTVSAIQDQHATKTGTGGNHTWLGRTNYGGGGLAMPGGPDTVHPVVTITNSETGFGRFEVSMGILHAFCVNMAVVENSITKIHLGQKMQAGIFSRETIESDSRTVMLQARDVIHAAFDVRTFKRIIERVKASAQVAIEAPTAAIDNIIKAKDAVVGEAERDSLLTYFVRDYKPSAYGLAQAVSRLAQDTDDADHASDLEALAGRIMVAPAAYAKA
jgi:hypothetical protein